MFKEIPEIMKKALAILALILVAEAAFIIIKGTEKKAAEVKQVQALKVVGTNLVFEDGTPAVFRGISFGWHNIWPRFYNAKAVTYLAENWGANIFRAAIGADSHAKADNPDIHDGYMGEHDFAIECAVNVIDAAIANNCYVIVDWHSHVMHLEEAKKFFTEIATRYKGVPNVIYEIFNEPVCYSFENGSEDPYSDLSVDDAMLGYWMDLKAYAEEIIATITAIDDRQPLILMGCPSWDQRVDLPARFPVMDYGNIMYTMHFYAATHGAWLREATDKAIEAGIPIFISECAGCEADGNGVLDEEAWNVYSDWATEKGISMMAWSISDKDETCSMLTPDAASEGGWTEEQIKPWGKLVKNWINNSK